MSERLTPHPPDEQLLAFREGDMGAGDTDRLLEHLDHCPECRTRLAELQETFKDYVHYHRNVLKPSLPGPPLPWEDLTPRFRQMSEPAPLRQLPRRSWGSPRRWLAAAAAVILSVMVARWLKTPPTVSAAELLEKAAAVETTRRPGGRLRIRTRTRTVVRPAILVRSAAAGRDPNEDLRTLFSTARYSWEDPLSASSFRAWRSQLPEKEDEVKTTSAQDEVFHRIRTTTPNGPLVEATLTLRARDLHPVQSTLQFRDAELVEITEMPGEMLRAEAPEPSAAPRPSLDPVPTATGVSGPGLELRVVAALHQLGADLGEPVELIREGSRLLVVGTGIPPARWSRIQEQLSPIPGVEAIRKEPGPVALSSTPLAESAGVPRSGLPQEVLTRLEGISAEQFVNAALDASEALAARAHALRALADRFPPTQEELLDAAERSLLASIRDNHAEALSARRRDLEAVLDPILGAPPSDSGPATPAGSWQEGTRDLLAAAQRLDQVLSSLLAGTGSARTTLADVRNSLRGFSAAWERYQAAPRQTKP